MKRKLIFITILLVANSFVFSQKHPIVDDKNSWATVSYQKMNPPLYFQTRYAYFDGDSIAGNNFYKKVFECNDELHENIEYQGLMREQDDKIFFVPVRKPETEYLFYDFSLEEGMLFDCSSNLPRPVTLYVKKVDFIEINGLMRKRIQMTTTNDYDRIIDTWIEGIGSLGGILWPYCFLVNGATYELLCYFQNKELIYKNPDYSECYYEGYLAARSNEKNGLIVYPNPANDRLVISDPEQTISSIEIFDVFGRVVEIAHPPLRGGLGGLLPPGIYFIRIQTETGIVTRKIVKQ